MGWAIMILGNLIGGFLSALSWSSRDNALLRFMSFVFPLGAGAGFWFYRYSTGFLDEQINAATKYFNGGAGEFNSMVAEAILTAIIFTIISKAVGLLFVKFIEK